MKIHMISMIKVYVNNHMYEIKFLLHPNSWQKKKNVGDNDFQKWAEYSWGPFVIKKYVIKE